MKSTQNCKFPESLVCSTIFTGTKLGGLNKLITESQEGVHSYRLVQLFNTTAMCFSVVGRCSAALAAHEIKGGTLDAAILLAIKAAHQIKQLLLARWHFEHYGHTIRLEVQRAVAVLCAESNCHV